MTVPKVSTGGWRLPAKNKSGQKPAGRFDRSAYDRLGLTAVVEGTQDAPAKPRGQDDAPVPASSGGLPSVDTSGWSLSEAKKRKPSKRGRPRDDEEQETTTRTALRMAGKVEMRGMSMSRIEELRQLAGLVPRQDREFALGTTHRRMPDDERAVPRMEESVSEKRPKRESRLSADQRRLVEGRRELPSGGFQPQRPSGSGMMDPVSEGEAHGTDFIDRVLSESRWFFHDFEKLGVAKPTLESPSRDDWEGSEPEYSDREMDLGDDDDDDREDDDIDDEEDDDEEEQSEARRVKYKHIGPGGTGRAVQQHKQSREQHHKNVSAKGRRGKKSYEKSAKGRHTRKMSKLRRRMHGEETLDDRIESVLDEKRRIGDALKRLGSKIGRGTKGSRSAVDRVKDKAKSWHDSEKKKHTAKKKSKLRRKQAKKSGYGHGR